MKVVILNPSFGDNFVRVARWSAKSRGRVQRHPEYLLTAAQVLIDHGHDVHFVEGDDPMQMHQAFAETLDTCYAKIRSYQEDARRRFAERTGWKPRSMR